MTDHTTTNDRHLHFCWLPRPNAPAPPPPWRRLSDALYPERHIRSPYHDRGLAPAPTWADDLRRVGRAVFAADRHAFRKNAFDRWTRHIRLKVPVGEPERWQRALPHLTALLTTSTGDVWDVRFVRLDESLSHSQYIPYPDKELTGEVSLFSGGLDSVGWVAQRAADADASGSLLLVGFDEWRIERDQRKVLQYVRGRYPRELLHLDHSQNAHGPGNGAGPERSIRSRGFLYAATAVHAAAAEGVPAVRVPENGQLALNPPLSAARSGACSTRSVHPWTLYHLNRVIEEIADPDRRAVRVENPFAGHTKGEVCWAAHKEAGLPKKALEATVSCGHSPRRRPGPSQFAHCGLCFPCLVRRSGLLAAFDDDRTPYEADPWNRTLSASATEHWRALRRWLSTDCTPLDLVAAGPLPPGAQPEELMKVVERGREELETLVSWAEGGWKRRKAAA